MISRRTWTIINISLVFIAFVLLLHLFGVELPTLGKAQYAFDTEEPLCVVHNWENEFVPWDDVDRCCLMIHAQQRCTKQKLQTQDMKLDYLCSSGTKIEYWLNSKAYNYCRQQSV